MSHRRGPRRRARACSSCPRRPWCCHPAGEPRSTPRARSSRRRPDRGGRRPKRRTAAVEAADLSRELDPISLQVLVGALRAACDEMGAVLIRSAHSPNIKERRDCSTALVRRARRAGDAGRAHPRPPRLDARRRRRGARSRPRAGLAMDPQRPVCGRHPPPRHHPDLGAARRWRADRIRGEPRPSRRRGRADPRRDAGRFDRARRGGHRDRADTRRRGGPARPRRPDAQPGRAARRPTRPERRQPRRRRTGRGAGRAPGRRRSQRGDGADPRLRRAAHPGRDRRARRRHVRGERRPRGRG